MGGTNTRRAGGTWFSDRARDRVGIRADAGRIEAHRRCRYYAAKTWEISRLDLRRCARYSSLAWSLLFRSLHREGQCSAATERGCYRFIHPAKIDRGIAV